MIKLREAELIDSLPDIVSKQPWAQAISYATARMFRTILDYADKARTFSAVDNLGHEVLDALAVDFRVAQYDQTFPLETKQKMIKYALQYWATAGTVAATENIVHQVFGDAAIEEWFDYDGTPGCFKVEINDTMMTDAEAITFKKNVENVKRLSAWLESIIMNIRTDKFPQYYGFINANSTVRTTKQERDPSEYWGFFVQSADFDTLIMEA